jgi:four helix bundle protein
MRAITSIGVNIAEGCGRYYKKNYRQFLAIARGSCFEVQYWLDIAIDLKKYNNEMLQTFCQKNIEIIKMLTVMMKNIERSVQS